MVHRIRQAPCCLAFGAPPDGRSVLSLGVLGLQAAVGGTANGGWQAQALVGAVD